MADLKQLGVQVSAPGLLATNRGLERLATAAQGAVTPLQNLQKEILLANQMDLTKLIKSLSSVSTNASGFKQILKEVNESGNGFKGISTSFSSLATAAEKLGNNVFKVAAFNSQLELLKKNLDGIKETSGALGSIKIVVGNTSTHHSGTTSSKAPETAANEAYTASQKRLIAQLEREAMQAGKTKAEYLELRAAKLGLSNIAEPYINQIKAASTTNGKYVMSQRELNAVMRNVPAQFTDIATQLAGGQSPWLIMLQQGGQLRDMFHGFGPMIKNVGGMILSFLTNPFVLAAGAIASVSAAFIFGAKESTDYGKALTLTGNYAGVTTQQFLAMQKSLAAVGESKSAVAGALTEIAASGKIAGTNIEGITKAVVDFSKQSGIAIKDVVAEYASLSRDPVSAIETLNEKYHFLTSTTYQHIQALVKQGEQSKAVALAQEELRKAHENMANTIKSNAGTLERSWQGFLNVLTKAKDKILEIGRPESLNELQAKLATVNKLIAQGGRQTFVPGMGMTRSGDNAELLAQKKQIEEQIAKSKGVQATQQKAANVLTTEQIENQKKITSLIEDGNKKLHSREAMQKELAALDKQMANSGRSYSPAEKEAARKAVTDKYEDKSAGNKESSINSELQRILEATRAYRQETAQLDKLGLQIDKVAESRKKLNAYQAELSSGKASEDRVKLLRTLIPALKEEASAEEANQKAKQTWNEAKQVQEKMQSVKALIETQKQEIEMLQNTGSLSSKMSENDKLAILMKKKASEASDSRVKGLYDETAAMYEQAAANEKLIKSLKDVNTLKSRGQARQEQGATELSTLSQKLGEGDVTDSRKLARSEWANEQKKINDLLKEQRDAQAAGSDEAVAQIQEQIDYERQLQQAKQDTIDKYDAEKGTIEGLMKSAGKAWDDFIGSSKSSEQDLHSLMSSSFSSLTGMWTTFCETGKLNFKSFTVSILKGIEEMIVKWLALRAVQALAGFAMSAFGSTSSSGAAASAGGSGMTGTISTPGLTYSAHGNAFTGSGLHKFAQGGAFTNGIYNQPTYFKFANGGSFSQGVMGEAGGAGEAVVPLARTSSGDLGVRTVGGQSAGNNIQININVESGGATSSTTSSSQESGQVKALSAQLGDRIKQVIVEEIRPNGILAKLQASR